MMRRTTESYVEVFRYVKTLAPNWDPRRVHCDFERAEMNAFIQVFPLCRVVGCLWHFGVVSQASYYYLFPLQWCIKMSPVNSLFKMCFSTRHSVLKRGNLDYHNWQIKILWCTLS